MAATKNAMSSSSAKAAASTESVKQITYLAAALKAPLITESAARLADQARDAGWTHEDYLAAVLEREVSARNASGAQLRIRAGVVVGDQPAHRDPGELVETSGHLRGDMASHVLEVDVDPVGRRGDQVLAEGGRPVVDRGVEAELLQQRPHFAGPPAMPTARAPLTLAIWPTAEPTGPVAAATTTVSPGCGSPIASSPAYAVKPGMPSTPSAVEAGAASGSSRRVCRASATAWVCQPV
jgi:hypothetical protein